MRSGKTPLHAAGRLSTNATLVRRTHSITGVVAFRRRCAIPHRSVAARASGRQGGRSPGNNRAGNQSPNGISPVREAIVSLLPLLRRRGVVSEWREHSPGSFVVKLGSITSLLDAPRRKRDEKSTSRVSNPKSLEGLESSTLLLLRKLAVRSLESLGIREPAAFVEAEMLSKFNSLAGGITPGPEGEARLREAISTALDHLDG